MRINILILFVFLYGLQFSHSVKAQKEINFSYDNSGNMISRVIYLPEKVIEEKDTLTTNSAKPDGKISDQDIDDETEQPEKENIDNYKDQIGSVQIIIYPNPTSGKLIVEIPNYEINSNDRIEIIDMQGVVKHRIYPINSSNTIYMNDYPKAIYAMIIYIGGETTQWKIIKQ